MKTTVVGVRPVHTIESKDMLGRMTDGVSMSTPTSTFGDTALGSSLAKGRLDGRGSLAAVDTAAMSKAAAAAAAAAGRVRKKWSNT